jgi:adenylylsulfate kinase
MSKRAIFVGRFCPFHNGHLKIMQKKIDEGKPLLIFVRDTHYDSYPAKMRKRMIELTMHQMKVDAKVVIIDDIESINYGRGVGYEVNEIQVDDFTKSISATEIRNRIAKADNSWKEFMPSGSREVLEDYLSKKGIVIWFTGLPCAGKKTYADLLSDELAKRGIQNERLNGSVLREVVSENLGFSKKDREKNLRRAAYIAKLLSRNGAVVISSFITPYESLREDIKNDLNGDARYIEVYVKASLEVCKKRDGSGMYEKAEKGKIKDFTGVSDRFDEPKNPDIIIDTEAHSIEENIEKLIDFIETVL